VGHAPYATVYVLLPVTVHDVVADTVPFTSDASGEPDVVRCRLSGPIGSPHAATAAVITMTVTATR
jgi:hypothetical protein